MQHGHNIILYFGEFHLNGITSLWGMRSLQGGERNDVSLLLDDYNKTNTNNDNDNERRVR
jgi:hypothetical protein